jgi:hypothetical protein
MGGENDKIFSEQNLRKYFKEGTANITDEQLKSYMRDSLADDVVKNLLMASIPDLMDGFRKSGEYNEEQLNKIENQLKVNFAKPEIIASTREKIINDPESLKRIRTALANPTEENMRKMHEGIDGSAKAAIANAVVEGIDRGYLNAVMWGATGAVTVAKNAPWVLKVLSFGKATPGLAVAIGVVEGLFSIRDFKNGNYEEGSKKLGGAAGGVAATLAAGAATVGVLATAPAWVPVAAAAAIGVAGYYAGRNIGEAAYLISEIHSVYAGLDAQYQPDQQRCMNLRGTIAEMLVQHPDMRDQFKALGVKTTKIEDMKDRDNWISLDDFQAALADPKTGPAVEAKMREYINAKKAGYEKIRDDNDHWYQSRYFTFTDAGANELQKHELAKLDARHMESALSEIESLKGQGRARLAAMAKAEADLAEAMKPFNNLDAGVKACITLSVEKNWQTYKAQNGDKAMDHDIYVMQNQAAIAARPEVLKIFQDAETQVQYIAGKQLEEWKTSHASATEAEINSQKDSLTNALRSESLNSPDAFKARLEHYQTIDAEAAKPAETAAVTEETTPVTTVVSAPLVESPSPATATTAFTSAATADGGSSNPIKIIGDFLSHLVNYLVTAFSSAVSDSTPANASLARAPRQMAPAPSMG